MILFRLMGSCLLLRLYHRISMFDKLLFIALIACAVLMNLSRVYGAPADESPQISELNTRLEQLTRRKITHQRQHKKLQQQLKKLETRRGQFILDHQSLNEELQTVAIKLKNLERKKAEQTTMLEEQFQIAVSHYRVWRRKTAPSMIHNLDSNHELHGRGVSYIRYLAYLSTVEIDGMNQKIETIQDLEKRGREEMSQLEILDEQNKSMIKQLESLSIERKQTLSRLEKTIDDDLQKTRLLRKERARLLNLLDSISQQKSQPATPIKTMKGQLSWPSGGKIRKRGDIQSELGVYLIAPAGTAVKSIYSGKVVFSGWLSHYGLLVIVDHGNDFLSVYGHLQTLRTRKNDWREAGEIIGTIGDSGGSIKPMLFFSLRKKHTVLDPIIWCKGKPAPL